MKKIIFLWFILFSQIPQITHSQISSIEYQQTTISIFRNGLGLINTKFNKNLPNYKTIVLIDSIPNSLDPHSIFLNFDGKILEQSVFLPRDNFRSLMEKFIGKEITFISKENIQIKGILNSILGKTVFLKNDQSTIVIPDATNYIMFVNDMFFPPKETTHIEFTIIPKKSGTNFFELCYLANNFSWECNYSIYLDEDEKFSSLMAWAIVYNNTNISFKSVKLYLVAGEISRVNYPPIGYSPKEMLAERSFRAENNQSFNESEKFFEYYTYPIPFTIDLQANQPKQFKILESNKVPVTKNYKIEFTEGSFQQKKQDNPLVSIKLENTDENNLGIPLPYGIANVYKKFKGINTLIGQTKLNSTPKNESINLDIGKAFDVVFEVEQTKFKKISEKNYQVSYNVTIRNHKNDEVPIQIIYNNNYPFELIKYSLEPTDITASSIIFAIKIPKNSSKVFSFSVNYSF